MKNCYKVYEPTSLCDNNRSLWQHENDAIHSLNYTPNEHLHNSIHFLFILSHQNDLNTHCNLISKLERNHFSRGLEGIKKEMDVTLKMLTYNLM